MIFSVDNCLPRLNNLNMLCKELVIIESKFSKSAMEISKIKNCFKLKLVAAACLIASSVAPAGIANANGNGSIENPYLIGVTGASPGVLTTTITSNPSSSFEEFANFTIPILSSISGSVNTYSLDLRDINVADITGLTVEVWSDIHPSGATLYASFAGDNTNTTNVIGDLATGQYHLDIGSNLGSSADTGQYLVELQALPVSEPETYALLLAGLGLVGLSVCRRKIA